MADRALLMTWKEPVRGREERAVECFNDALGICGRKQQEGAIESFDVVLCEPNGTLGGYIKIEGSGEQIAALRQDDEFRRNTVEASLTVDGLAHIECAVGEGIAEEMAMYRQVVGTVPQQA
jgi:hypothetical protein